MGSLGAARLNAASDLDLIVIYDPGEAETSDGPRPLAPRTYFARLTQALITALTAPMAEGRLYEVDMRLRPSGSQGPVATSLGSFLNYHRGEAWVWEHLALTRARVIAGNRSLGAEIEDFRRELLAGPHEAARVLAEVAEMRARIAAAKSPAGVWDVKTGAGRMMDIELVAQAGALLGGVASCAVADGLRGAATCGWLSGADAEALQAAYDLFWTVQSGTRLLAAGPIDTAEIGGGGAAFLCRSTGFDALDALQAALEARYAATEALVGAALDRDQAA